MARYSAVFVFYCIQNVKIDFLKFNLLPNEPIESFWDALWLGIRPFLAPMGVTLSAKTPLGLFRGEPTPQGKIEGPWAFFAWT